jgi:ATP-binding cassette subfamily C protein
MKKNKLSLIELFFSGCVRVLLDHPKRSMLVIFCLTLAAGLEIIGLSLILPLLEYILQRDTATSNFTQYIDQLFEILHITPSIVGVLSLVVALGVLKALVRGIAYLLVGYTLANIETTFRKRLISAMTKVRWQFYVHQPSGSLANALVQEVDQGANLYLYSARFFADLITVLFYGLLAAFVSWQVSVGALLVGVLSLTLLHGLVSLTHHANTIRATLLRKGGGQLVDYVNNFKTIRAMAGEGRFKSELYEQIDGLRKAKRLDIVAREALVIFQEPIFMVAMVVGIYLAVHYATIDGSVLLMLAFLFMRTLVRLGNIQAALQKVAKALPFYKSINELISDMEQKEETFRGRKAPSFKKSITLKELSFSYDDGHAIDIPNIDIKANKFTAIVGPSGVGKTTIMDMIIGLLRPQKGAVLIDNESLNKIDIKKWRQMIGYVPQESILFNGTLFANITLNSTDFTEEEVWNVLKLVECESFVKELENGLYTEVGEKGLRFSGGQKQRLAIARAILRKPALLILDEVTTALDPATEKAILKTIKKLSKDTTILAISHQPALMKACDEVYKLEKKESNTGSK